MRVTPILLTVAVMITGCSTTPEPAPAQPGVLSVGIGAVASPWQDRMISNALYTPLIDHDPATGKITPRAAESVTGTPDQITWTIKLRPGTYHDGAPVTAGSYVDAWRKVAGQPIPFDRIDAVDDLTIRLTTKSPASYVPAFLASVWALPVRAGKELAGNGPFRLEGPWDNEKGGRLVRVNPVGSKARQIDLRVHEDLAAAFDEVKAGRLDLVVDFPGSRHQSMHQDFANRHAVWPKPRASYLLFGPDLPDPAARYAIALSIDRKTVATGPLDNQFDPATRLYPPAVAPGERADVCRACNFDAGGAKALGDQAGLKAVRFADGGKGELDAVNNQVRTHLGVTTGDGPAVEIRDQRFTFDSPHQLFEGLDLPAVKPFLDAAAASGDPVVRAENYRLVENEILRELPVLPLWTEHGHAVWAERVRDVTATAAHGVDLTSITV
ncbi:ABC transporter substrate-binding protein [Kibdelosporangium persicum]|uniref:Oligopeptide transport system substrate-binding protein n=1 Tax=Kibdelosporangium persicum TaxID=2698649 RepID=A0ABX2F987_9PSEU|nr:ABC transporter substrate-binding protein [Kibdelosporangium persicum]NRN67520.1 Oligopeptide transport system substrate-binding protein [Kibdelosporangium persicum]